MKDCSKGRRIIFQMFHILSANARLVKGASYYVQLIIHILPANTTGQKGCIIFL